MIGNKYPATQVYVLSICEASLNSLLIWFQNQKAKFYGYKPGYSYITFS